MKPKPQALLLVGSPRGSRSTSASLGNYLLERLRERDFDTRWLLAHRAVRDARSRQSLIRSVAQANLVVLAFPLYVDCLPYPMIRTLEIIAAQPLKRASVKGQNKQRLVAMVSCGFPEAFHNDTALAICRQFARETGRHWAGGLALGSGGVIDGQPLAEIKRLARKVIRALDMAAEALACNRDIPPEAVALMSKPLIPKRLYRLVASLKFLNQAIRHRQFRRLWRRPFDAL